MKVEEMLMKPDENPWTPLTRVAERIAINQSLQGLTLKRAVSGACKRGREFGRGSAAETVLQSANSHLLTRAASNWRKATPQFQRIAKEFVVEFLQKVTYEHFCKLKWAAKFCRLILTTEIVESSSPAAIVDGDPQASEPSPAPATAADVKPGTDALSAAGNTLRKQWMGKEFTITLTKIQSGEVKMTVWALGQKCRRENHKRLQRLRSVYNIDKQGAAASFPIAGC